MQYEYVPVGVCSQKISVDIREDQTIGGIAFLDGCRGNLEGISKLAQGRNVLEIIELLDGIDCEGRGTSCPDQLANMLKQIMAQDSQPKSGGIHP